MMQVGLSTTRTELALTHGHLDGIGIYTMALMQALPDCGCQMQGFSFAPFGKSVRARGFTHSKAMPNSFINATLRDLAAPVTAPCNTGSDIFHCTDYQVVRMACPVVATVHDAVPLMHPEWVSPRLRSLKNWVQKRAVAKADHVIALSQFSVAELVQYFGIDARQISVVHAGVSASWLEKPSEPAVAATIEANNLQPGYFLFVGTLQPRKNVERILEAYLALPQATRRERQLVIVGRVGWQCEELVRRITAAIQHGERVVWLQDLRGEQALRHIYAAAGTLVFPSLYEGFGIPVAEAFACGVPVITSNVTSLPEVSQGAALELNPLDVGAISEAMQHMVRDEALRARCIAAGYQRALDLSWQQCAARTAAVYRQVLSG
ncbi:MAG: glycosyltransferase family 4 protein [Burkholderiaceae bacterium]